MSRIAKKGVKVPPKAEITVASGAVTIKGPKGSLNREIPESLEVKVADGFVSVSTLSAETGTAFSGTLTSHINNMFKGVTEGFTKKLILEGVGYKADVKGKELVMALGFSHPVKVPIPEGLAVTSDKGAVVISGINKDQLGQFAAYVRDLKKPEPYKGKGFRYEGEVIRRKQGKKAA